MTSLQQTYAPDLQDYWHSVSAAVLFTVLRMVETNYVLRPLAGWLGIDGQRSVSKFCEAVWKLQNWIPLFIMGFLISSQHEWFFNGLALWSNWPNPMTFWIRAYYLIELGWYGHAQITLTFFETETGAKRSDFWPMTVHHFTTVALISFSYFQGYTPIGCMIMWVHDVVDIFLEAALACKEMRWHKACDALFVMFATSWVVFRLGIFPFHLVYSIERDILNGCPRRPGATSTKYYLHELLTHPDGVYGGDPTVCQHQIKFFVLLSILVVLHIYWFYLIARMINRAIFEKTVAGDIRDDEVDGRSDTPAVTTASDSSLAKPAKAASARRSQKD